MVQYLFKKCSKIQILTNICLPPINLIKKHFLILLLELAGNLRQNEDMKKGLKINQGKMNQTLKLQIDLGQIVGRVLT